MTDLLTFEHPGHDPIPSSKSGAYYAVVEVNRPGGSREPGAERSRAEGGRAT